MPITVSIVEDDASLRQRLEAAIDRTADLKFLSSYSSAETALPVLETLSPRVLLVDVNLEEGGMTGIELVQRLRPCLDSTDILMLTICNDPTSIFSALEAGANGYLLKDNSLRGVVEAVREVHRGGAPMSGDVARLVVQSFCRAKGIHPQNALSVREHEILNLLSRGLSYKEIGLRLKLSYHTVHSHVRNIYGKLHARTRFEALRNSGRLRA